MWITIFVVRNIYRAKDGGGVTSLLQPCAVSSKTQEEAGRRSGHRRREDREEARAPQEREQRRNS
jgi:hypothetical protein